MPLNLKVPALLLILTVAQVLPHNSLPEANFTEGASINDCDVSTFIYETSDASPLVLDCLQIATNIAGGGTWEVEDDIGQQHQLVQYGTCAFGVQGSRRGGLFHVGNQDIIDLIIQSVLDFGSDGKHMAIYLLSSL
jgi:hypothetical protein